MYSINPEKIKCPRCGSRTGPTVAVDQQYCEFTIKCVQCPTYIQTFLPMPHQHLFLKDPARYVMTAGGVGTGKTISDVFDKIKHALITPHGTTLLGAPTMPQLRATLKKDLERNLPIDWVESISRQENKITLKNGHEFLYRPFDDPEKLRSLNLSSFVILEASRSKYSIFTELQRRLRNTAAVRYKKDEHGHDILTYNPEKKRYEKEIEADWRKGTLETNPDAGWVKTQILERSGKVTLHHPDLFHEHYHFRSPSPAYSTHIAPTKVNYTLPASFVEDQSHGMPDWYIRRNFYGSFQYAEGMIYPRFLSAVTTPFKIPKHWKRIIGMDYGISDRTHALFGAIDPINKICYIYDELVINDADIHTISNAYKQKIISIPHGAYLTTPVLDQRSMSKRQAHDVQKTLGDLFLDEGLVFDPAQMNMNARILRTNTLINLGQLKIFSNCQELIEEGRKYKFVEKDIDKPHLDTDKPQDKFNHGINALEFIVMELPHNLEQMDFKMYNNKGKALTYDIPDPTPRPYNPLENDRRDDYDSDSDYGDDLYDYTRDW